MASHREGLGRYGQLSSCLPDNGHVVRNLLILSRRCLWRGSLLCLWLFKTPKGREKLEILRHRHTVVGTITILSAVCTENLNPDIVVMKPAKDRA